MPDCSISSANALEILQSCTKPSLCVSVSLQTTPAAAEPAAEPDVAEADAGASNSWFSEVVELRKKAAEYKKRALGTHFSREHLAQLYARQAELWDTVSQSSSLSALSLEATQAKK